MDKEKITKFAQNWRRMAEPLSARLESLRVKVSMLNTRYLDLKQQHQEAQNEIALLKAQAEQAKQEINRLEAQNQQLRVATVLAPDHRDVEKTRTFLTGLVREIDKAIALLTQ